MFCDFLINSFFTQLNELNISLVQWYKWHRMCSRQNFLRPQYPAIYLHQLRAGFAGYGFEQQHFFFPQKTNGLASIYCLSWTPKSPSPGVFPYKWDSYQWQTAALPYRLRFKLSNFDEMFSQLLFFFSQWRIKKIVSIKFCTSCLQKY